MPDGSSTVSLNSEVPNISTGNAYIFALTSSRYDGKMRNISMGSHPEAIKTITAAKDNLERRFR
jgi:hypothetical protein